MKTHVLICNKEQAEQYASLAAKVQAIPSTSQGQKRTREETGPETTNPVKQPRLEDFISSNTKYDPSHKTQIDFDDALFEFIAMTGSSQ